MAGLRNVLAASTHLTLVTLDISSLLLKMDTGLQPNSSESMAEFAKVSVKAPPFWWGNPAICLLFCNPSSSSEELRRKLRNITRSLDR
ncbi:hypothetical protein AVEN_186700-1 [Araneus ventricosus]|uniref:Uncharacterized protein n=1 Tax=Araneus ventricosus TaxID=182803 RepID=A0A4Y2V4C9_ARAVE|nr:hypothetical protein AVEN_186700-1 [Araneus ventricosus]